MNTVRKLKEAIINAGQTSQPTSSFNISESSYKISHKTNRSQSRLSNHSIEKKKSPARTSAQYRAEKSPRTGRSEISQKNSVRTDNPILSAPVTMNNTMVPNASSTRTGTEPSQKSIFDALSQLSPATQTKSFESTQMTQKQADPKLTESGIMCMRQLWNQANRLGQRQGLAVYAGQIKSILNKICKTGVKPEFNFNPNSTAKNKQKVDSQKYEGIPIHSSPYSPSYTKSNLEESIHNNDVPKQLDFGSTRSEYQAHNLQIYRTESEQTKPIYQQDSDDQCDKLGQNLQYKKILYMLERKSKGDITEKSSLFSDQNCLTYSNSKCGASQDQTNIYLEGSHISKRSGSPFQRTGMKARTSSPTLSTMYTEPSNKQNCYPVQPQCKSKLTYRSKTEAQTNKHRVNLKQIVDLLNTKYNRNIRLTLA